MPGNRRPRNPLLRAGTLGTGAAALLVAVLLVVGRGDVVFQSPSPFGDVRVVERPSGVRELYLGDSSNRQTAMDPDEPLQLELPYTEVMLVAAGTVSDSARVLFVGLGGGSMPMWLRIARPELRIDIVEISPAVVEAAREWFGFVTDSLQTLHVEDAADFVAQAPARAYDLIILDAFDATGVPEALQSEAFFGHIERILASEGIVASNLWYPAPTHRALIDRHGGVFRHLVAVQVPRRRQEILFATNRGQGLDAEDLQAARAVLQASPAGAPTSEDVIRRGFRIVP